jgi:hypothetical protein
MIQREDLVAAASLGLLQYRQVDPLLLYLLQRDLRSRREEMLAQARPSRTHAVLSYLAVMLAVAAAALVALMFTGRAVESLGIGALFCMTVVYALSAVGLASWFKRLGFAKSIRVLCGSVVALGPVAVFSVQHVLR